MKSPFDDPFARISTWGDDLRKDEFLLPCNKLDNNVVDGVKTKLHRYGLCVIRRTGAGFSTKRPSGLSQGSEDGHMDPNLDFLLDALGVASSQQSETDSASKLIVTNNYSDALSGNNPGPLAPHTDGSHLPLPPPIVILQYLQTAEVGGTLSFIDFAKVLEDLYVDDPERTVSMIRSLQSPKAVRINKPLPGGGQVDHEGEFLFQVPYYTSLHSYGYRGRLDDKVIPSQDCQAYFEKLRGTIGGKGYKVTFIPETTDIVIIDNWRVLHGRSTYAGVGDRSHRRVWIESPTKEIQESIPLGIRPLDPSRIFRSDAPCPQTINHDDNTGTQHSSRSSREHPRKPRTNLDLEQDWSSFVGREDYQNELREKFALTYKWEVYIKGVSGVGKTALVKKVAQESFCQENSEYDYVLFYSAKIRELTPNGILPVSIANEIAFNTLELLSTNISRVCGIWLSHVGPQQLESQLRKFLGSGKHKFLIIIDNFETLTPPEKQKVWSFFRDVQAPESLKVVYTSRSLDFHSIEINPLTENEAREMVRNELPILSSSDIDNLIRYCDRIPLAIEWSIPIIKNRLTVTEFTERRKRSDDETGDELLNYMFDDLARLIKEKNALAYTILKGLSVTSCSLGKSAIQNILRINKLGDLSRALEILVRYSLANVANSDQYILKTLVREYSSGLFDSEEEKRYIISEWIKYFLDFTLTNGGDDWGEWRLRFGNLDAYWDNIQELFSYLRYDWRNNDSSSYEKSKVLWRSLLRFTYLYGYWGIREKWTDDLLDEAQVRGDSEFYAKLLAANGWIYLLREGEENYIKASSNFNKAIGLLGENSGGCTTDLIETKWTIYLNFAAARVRQKKFKSARQLFETFAQMWIGYVKGQGLPRICLEKREQSRFFLRYLLYWGEYFYRYGNSQKARSLTLEIQASNLIKEGFYEDADRCQLQSEMLLKDASRCLFKAECCYRRVAILCEVIEWKRFQAKAMERIAYLKIRAGEFKEASKIIDDWMNQSIIYSDKRRVAFFIKDKALLHEGLNERSKALEAAEDALKRFGELDMLKRVEEVNAIINRLKRQ
jgi:hypothetical protein